MNTTLHAPVEALLKMMRENGLHHDDIVEIDAAWQRVEPFLAKSTVSTVVARRRACRSRSRSLRCAAGWEWTSSPTRRSPTPWSRR